MVEHPAYIRAVVGSSPAVPISIIKRGGCMNPVKFLEQNSIFRYPDCSDLPALHIRNEHFDTDEVISCWEFSNEELIQILKDIQKGKRPQIFLSVIGGQPPVALYMRDEAD